MSDVIIGHEILPNVYIKRIEVFDGVDNKVNIKALVYLTDSADPANSMWSYDAFIIHGWY